MYYNILFTIKILVELTHGLFTSKNVNVVAFAIKLLAVLKALSCWEDHDHTAFTCVSSVSGFTISARFGVKRDK